VKGEHVLPSQSQSARQLSATSDSIAASANAREGRHEDALQIAWRSYASANNAMILRYIEVYTSYVYPIFPLFHIPTLLRRLQQSDHMVDHGFFASVMAACSLAAARARDGAIPESAGLHVGKDLDTNSEIFFAAAQSAVCDDLSKASSFSIMRACGLLALTSIQYGRINSMHQYMGHYHTLSAMHHFHDENTWSEGLTIPAREERRRLFWSMYQLDVFIACVFEGMPHVQEVYANVTYPAEILDDDLTPVEAASPGESNTWLRGFNFTIHLYRILAATLTRMRMDQTRQDRIPIHPMFIGQGAPAVQIMDQVVAFYFTLPAEFRRFDLPVTGIPAADIIGFQVANIQATLQLVRMTLIDSCNQFDGDQKCLIVEQVLAAFTEINPFYLRAISTPLVFHLGRIGHILASVIQGPMTDVLYNRARQLLGSLADLLEGLESSLQPTVGASKELRDQIEKIDTHMQEQEHMDMRVARMQHQMAPNTMTHGIPTNSQSSQIPFRSAQAMTGGSSSHGPMDEFQLPPELTGEWPWPFDVQAEQNYHVAPGYSHEGEKQ
jgi:hypothetical protein